MEQIKNGISRRTFLAGTGAAIGALAAGGVVGYQTTALAAPTVAGFFPWPALDVNDKKLLKEKAVFGYALGGCCYGAAYGLIEVLKSKTGGAASPWAQLPMEMYRFGLGGALSWGTVCGALNGSVSVINAVFNGLADATKPQTDPANAATDCYPAKFGAATDELMQWYQNTAFPLADPDLDSYITTNLIASNVYDVLDGKTGAFNWAGIYSQPTSVCGSPLCHASVSTWCDVSGKTYTGEDKKVRCARLTADVAAKTVELIDKAMANGYPIVNFLPTYDFRAGALNGSTDCMDCHTGTGTKSAPHGGGARFDNEQGKMDCYSCHDDKKSEVGYIKKNMAPACDR